MPHDAWGGAPVAVSNGGGTLAATLINNKAYIRAYVHRDGDWRSMPGLEQHRFLVGLSSDGSSVLYADGMHHRSLVLDRAGFATRIEAGPGMRLADSALSPDGTTIFYSQHESSQLAAGSVHRWRNGVSTTLATLPDLYSTPAQFVVGALDDIFVMNLDLRDSSYNVGGPRRAVIFNRGNLTAIGVLSSAAYTRSNAVAMSGDGSLILGNETSWDDAGGWTYGNKRAWTVRDGVFSELTIDGFSTVRALGLSLDGSTMLVDAWNEPGTGLESFLLYDDGRRLSVDRLLADAGLSLGDGAYTTSTTLSHDGLTVAGLVIRPDGGSVPNISFFTLTVPGPASVFALGAAGLFAARRRR